MDGKIEAWKSSSANSSQDADLAKALVELLRASLPLASADIRCSSVDGYRLPVGADTDDILREEVFNAKVLIALLTPTSLGSTYVLFELGARWGARLPIAPILARGVMPILLPGPLVRLNALELTSPSQLMQFLYDIGQLLGTPLEPPASYQDKINAVASLASAAESAPNLPRSVPARDLRAAFLAGYALGNPLTLFPAPVLDQDALSASLGGLQETTQALTALGLTGEPLSAINQVGEAGFESTPTKEDIEAFFESIHNLRAQARAELAHPLREWYVTGELLARIGVLPHVEEDVDLEHDVIALNSIIDLLDAPPSLVAALRKFAEQAGRSQDDGSDLFTQSQLLARAISDVLDAVRY